MWLAICEVSDVAGLWAVIGLRRLGVKPLEIVLPEELVFGARWSHGVGGSGADVRIRLRDGREIRSDRIAGVLNRLGEIPASWLERIRREDRDYVAQEWHALLTSSLTALACPVLNPPSPPSLCGAWRHTSEWRLLAAAAGLETLPFRMTSEAETPSAASLAGHGLVIGPEVVGPIPPVLHERCISLAAAARTPLLGIDFGLTPEGQWCFQDATPLPDLRVGGRASLEALRRALGA